MMEPIFCQTVQVKPTDIKTAVAKADVDSERGTSITEVRDYFRLKREESRRAGLDKPSSETRASDKPVSHRLLEEEKRKQLERLAVERDAAAHLVSHGFDDIAAGKRLIAPADVDKFFQGSNEPVTRTFCYDTLLDQ